MPDLQDTVRKEAPNMKSDCETFGGRSDFKPQVEQAALVHKLSSTGPARARRLDPVLQAEALRAKANLERIKRQAEEAAAASGDMH
jgi:hypothetical protein